MDVNIVVREQEVLFHAAGIFDRGDQRFGIGHRRRRLLTLFVKRPDFVLQIAVFGFLPGFDLGRRGTEGLGVLFHRCQGRSLGILQIGVFLEGGLVTGDRVDDASGHRPFGVRVHVLAQFVGLTAQARKTAHDVGLGLGGGRQLVGLHVVTHVAQDGHKLRGDLGGIDL